MQPEQLAIRSRSTTRFGLGFAIVFALPFIGIGLFALVQGLRNFRPGPQGVAQIAFGAVFTIAGLSVLWGATRAASASSKRQASQAQHPGEPWMWRDDWAARAIQDSNTSSALGLWIFAIIWNAISFPMALLVIRPEIAKGNRAALLGLIFPAVGVVLVIVAAYLTARRLRFGNSTCHLEQVPVVPGRRFRGDIQLRMDATPEDGYRIQVASIRSVTTGSGKSRSTTEHLLWDREIVVDAAGAMRSPMGVRIPFELATPPDGHTTDESDPRDRWFWRLSASACFPGVDYAAQFQLPVFRTAEEVDGSEFEVFQERHRSQAARQQLPRSSGVEITRQLDGGEQFRIQARRTIGATMGLVLFVAIWSAVIAVMIRFGAPSFFIAIFVAIDLLLIWGFLDGLVGKTTVTVAASGVTVLREWFGKGRTTSYDAAKIASIEGVAESTNGASSAVAIKFKDGTKRVIARYLPGRESADIVAAKMMANLPQG